jgi:bifunctional enzyme CysN/CysC
MKETQEDRGMPGVIWITGFSSAGKTTVGRRVEGQLRSMGFPTVFLDGDDLRSILGSHWGYERAQRIDLARVYFRLCSHLASQGFTVIMSAVAMYDEIYDWFDTNIPRGLRVYLSVPEDERRQRDEKSTKRVYKSLSDLGSMYDEPTAPDLLITNDNSASPEDAALRIVDFFRERTVADYDFGREEHWKAFYTRATVASNPSPFAESVAEGLEGGRSILEIGCGNGRDASFFSRQGHAVTALDRSAAAIEKCREDYADLAIDFLAGDMTEHADVLRDGFDLVYSRFVLHAMPLQEEIGTLQAAFSALRPGGEILIECRSINDPLARQGEVIGPTERIHGHYRRFIIMEDLQARLETAGFEVLSAIEGNGLAVFGDDDPVVIRVRARKPE